MSSSIRRKSACSLRLSFFHRDWFNAIQNKDEAAFWSQLFTVFTPWAFLYIATAVLEFVVTSTLIIRWRRWLTGNYVSRWLDAHTHYRMSLAGGAADNPDQRISEDINRFIDGGQIGYGIYSFSILLISNLSSLVSFAILLWDLSANFTLPYTTIAVPGFLFWVALIYAGVGTLVTHLIGRPLVKLSFERQRYEADFRFSLARLREYAEQVALLSGETTEKASLTARFGAIVKNYFQIVACRKNLIGIHGVLWPAQPDHSLRRRRAVLFRRQDHARHHDADGESLRQRQRGLDLLCHLLCFARRFQSRARPFDVVRPRDREREDAGLRAKSRARTPRGKISTSRL